MKHCRKNKKPVDTLDAEFHLSIARACHNTIYYLVARTILHLYTQATRISHSELFLNDNDQDQLLDDHEGLFKAISSHDAEKASMLMRKHLDRVSRKLSSSL
jgi:DNA-binding FadR family transcriptional regulator